MGLENATAKDYSLIIYNKTEIDYYRDVEETRINDELSKKSDKVDEGSPSGIATLDPTGKHSLNEIPIASQSESETITVSDKLMTPERVNQHLVTNGYLKAVDADNRYGNLESDGSVPMDANFNPQNAKDIATVEYVQNAVSSNTNTYVVDTLAEMLAISPLIVGDVCFVTHDPDSNNNGEYLALVAVEGGSVISNWQKRTASVSWGSILGSMSAQTDLENRFTSLESDVATNILDIDANSTDILANTIATTDNANAIAINTADITTIKPEIAEHERQLNMDTSKLGVDIDTILTTGYYEVNTNLPYGLTAGELRVGYDTQLSTRIIQEYTDLYEAVSYRRQHNNGAWSPWQETAQSKFNDDSQLFATNLSQTKADIEYVNKAIINTYTGSTPPPVDLGKNGDKYHQYATEAPTTELLVGQSSTAYTPTGVFGLFFDPTATGPQYLAINAETREVFFEYGSDGFPIVNDIQMEIDGNALFLTVKSQTAVGATLTYTNTYDTLVSTIDAGTPFRVTSRGLSGSETDYTKAQGKWYITPIYDNTFDYASSQDVTVQDIGFTQLVRLTTPDRDAGIYQITFNVNAQYNSTTSSMRFRYSLDGGQQWSPVVWKEPKDTSDTFVLTDTFVYSHSGGVFDAIIQGACESATQTLTANFSNIIIDRKS